MITREVRGRKFSCVAGGETMTLGCYVRGMKCPRYKHDGVFQPDDETIERLMPDVNRCADCMAYSPPQCPDFRADFRQMAVVVLLEEGPIFDPDHSSGSSFGTFIRPRICGSLTNAKREELEHRPYDHRRIDAVADFYGAAAAETDRAVGCLRDLADENAAFEDRLIRDISLEAALPELLEALTEREREVFAKLREDRQQYEIAEVLHISAARVSKLVKDIHRKVSAVGERIGLSGD